MWRVACGVWRVACGVWRVACGVWRVACGVWRVACGVWRVPCAVCRVPCAVCRVACCMGWMSPSPDVAQFAFVHVLFGLMPVPHGAPVYGRTWTVQAPALHLPQALQR